MQNKMTCPSCHTHIATENTHLENLLDDPAVVPLEGLVISFSDIDANKIGIVLISLPIR